MHNAREDIIIWQKWADPFGEETEEKLDSEPSFDDDNDLEEDNIGIDHYHSLINKSKPIKVIATPMGIIPINEDTASGKIFNFWIGHTNFDITIDIAKLIEKIEGVECLSIFTRYRFRIAIGKAFTDSIVMKDIQDSIYEFLQNTND